MSLLATNLQRMARTQDIMVNGHFDHNINGWTNPSSMFQWSSGRAYHPFGNTYSGGFNQTFASLPAGTRLFFDLELVQGGFAVWSQSNAILSPNYPTTGLYIGEEISIPTGTTRIGFARRGSSTGFEGYIDNVRLILP